MLYAARVFVNAHHSVHICIWSWMPECRGGTMCGRLTLTTCAPFGCFFVFRRSVQRKRNVSRNCSDFRMWMDAPVFVQQLKFFISEKAICLFLVWFFVLLCSIFYKKDGTRHAKDGHRNWHISQKRINKSNEEECVCVCCVCVVWKLKL